MALQRVAYRLLDIEVERIAELVRLVLVGALVAGPGFFRLVTTGAVLEQLAEEVAECLLADGAHRARRELVAAFALLDQARVFEHARQIRESCEGAGRVVAEQIACPVDVDLGQLTRLRRRAQQIFEIVKVAERVEQAGHLAHRKRIVAVEVHAPLPRQVGKGALQVARELLHLPVEVDVFHQRLGECLELRALLGRHRVEQLLHLRHRLRHLFEQLIERLRIPGEEVAVALHEPGEIGFLAALTLLEHVVELGEHVLHSLHALGREVLHALGELVEVALHELLAQLVHQFLELLARAVVHEVVLLERLHLARQVGQQLVELAATLRGEVLDDLLAPPVPRLLRLVDATFDSLALTVDNVVEPLGDIVVYTAEVARLQLLTPALLESLKHLAQTHELFAVAVAQTLLQHAAERRVDVVVVDEIVGHLRQQRVGIEVEAGLGAVPP